MYIQGPPTTRVAKKPYFIIIKALIHSMTKGLKFTLIIMPKLVSFLLFSNFFEAHTLIYLVYTTTLSY